VAEKLPVSAVARRLHREHGASWFNSHFSVLRHASLFGLWQAPPARLMYVTEQSRAYGQPMVVKYSDLLPPGSAG